MTRKNRYYFDRVIDYLLTADFCLVFKKIVKIGKYGSHYELAGEYCEGECDGIDVIFISQKYDILNTIIHEVLHALYKKKKEAEVYRLADQITDEMSNYQVIKLLCAVMKHYLGKEEVK